MKKRGENNLLVGLDIGTTKVVVLVGSLSPENSLDLIGIGVQPARGLKKGIVVNIDATVQSIKQALEEAEAMAGCEIHSVYTGISGSHIRSLNSHGIVAIRNHEVTQSDIDRVIDAAQAVAIPANQKILHVLPQEFIIDNQGGIKEPIGMFGVRLEAKVHIVTGSVSAVQNIVRCIERCNLHVSDIILQPLASSAAVLTDDEKELGICLIDIGGGTTDIAVFTDGAIRHSAVIPIAGNQVTSDIAVALHTPTRYAEAIKCKYACAIASDDVDTNIDVPNSASQLPHREVSQSMLVNVVGARYEELFSLVKAELKRSKFLSSIGAGIVLTGGASKIPGVVELAEQVFGLPVRIGAPENVTGAAHVVGNPVYSTGAGLLLAGATQHRLGLQQESSFFGESKSLFSKMKAWFQANF